LPGQVKDIYTHRYLLWGIIRADLRNRYGASFFGLFWSVINPLLLILVYTLVFGYILDINIGGTAGPQNYGLFLFCGMLPWLAIQDAMQRSSNVIMENRDLIKQVNFPKLILPVRCVISAFFHQLIAMFLFVIIILSLGQIPSPLMLGLLVTIWPLQLLFTLGLTLIISAFSVFYKDMREFTGAFTLLWFFATPIIFPMGLIPEKIRIAFFFNPLTPLINLYRSALLGDVMPDPYGFLYFSVFTILLLVVGWFWFRRMSKDFADLI
jgi:homopolymeric O-antigen transport system permease protein